MRQPITASLSVRATTLAMPTVNYYQDRDFLYQHRTGDQERPGSLIQLSRNGDFFWSVPPGNALFGYFAKGGRGKPVEKSLWDEAMRQHLERCRDYASG